MSSILRRNEILDDPEGGSQLSLSDDRADDFDYDSLESKIASVTINSPQVERGIAKIQKASRQGRAALQLEDSGDLTEALLDLEDKGRD